MACHVNYLTLENFAPVHINCKLSTKWNPYMCLCVLICYYYYGLTLCLNSHLTFTAIVTCDRHYYMTSSRQVSLSITLSNFSESSGTSTK